MARWHTGDGIYQPVESWYHRKKEEWAEFVLITTVSNRTLKLTPDHLVPLLDCDEASRVREGRKGT